MTHCIYYYLLFSIEGRLVNNLRVERGTEGEMEREREVEREREIEVEYSTQTQDRISKHALQHNV